MIFLYVYLLISISRVSTTQGVYWTKGTPYYLQLMRLIIYDIIKKPVITEDNWLKMYHPFNGQPTSLKSFSLSRQNPRSATGTSTRRWPNPRHQTHKNRNLKVEKQKGWW
jgi:hypothetical protein